MRGSMSRSVIETLTSDPISIELELTASQQGASSSAPTYKTTIPIKQNPPLEYRILIDSDNEIFDLKFMSTDYYESKKINIPQTAFVG